ncbi:helix-turn-helix domain-containing protein [Allokutzneria oryzae]|uniref:Helix-turn-helix domain-containing protein n=1 Tax=Allokutzneria oryzae TaxID=1378989 RepID=A0ABV5ZYH8_9PSEU
MVAGLMIERARHEAGLTQEELAHAAGTSRPTLSAYEHDRKSPTMATMERLLRATGHTLAVEPLLSFSDRVTSRGRLVTVPSSLPRLEPRKAFAKVVLPLHLNWSSPGTVVDLSDRRQRALCYEVVLREGGADDIREYVDGALLVDLWDELVLPREVRAFWEPVVEAGI